MTKLFGTDGIRGEANRYPMDGATAFAVGQAVTRILKKPGRPMRVIIGRDTRLSGCMLEDALASGVMSMGGVAELVGVLPTPGIAFVTRSTGADAGLVVSASHNPYQDNGIKVFSGEGFKLSDDQEAAVEDLVFGGRLAEMVPAASEVGRARCLDDATERYAAFLKSTFPRTLSVRGLGVVLDTANGAACRIAPMVFGDLGADVTVIHDSPDGLNINERCGSQHTEDLREAVVDSGAAIGLAFDGDGDRLIAVDETGSELTGDQTLIVCARMLKDEGRLKNDLLVSTVMSNMGLAEACREYGFENHAAKVGDRYVLEDMRRLGAVLGGEQSGHVIFLDHHTTGDGVLTAVQLVAAMATFGRPLSDLARFMEVFPQKLIDIPVKSKPDLKTVPAVVAAVRKAETELKDRGRVLLRYSGTQDLCRVMVEGPDSGLTERLAADLAAAVKASID